MNELPPRTLVLTPGDPDGIGPEITWKAIQSGIQEHLAVSILCVGAKGPFEKLGVPTVRLGNTTHPKKEKKPSSFIWIEAAPEQAPKHSFHLSGFQSGWAIQRATERVLAGSAKALVTGPISKENLQAGGFSFPGHTEFLASLCGSVPVTMMLANKQLRVSLVTIHIALKDVPSAIGQKELTETILNTANGLRDLWGIQVPKIGVAAINPHAGESGLFGTEEITILKPTLASIQKKYAKQFQLFGPLPADTLFANHILALRESPSLPLSKNTNTAPLNNSEKYFDAVVCMYHDQGLIPVKLLDFHKTINVTLGLPMIRTSVDHGVGFDIAGKGIANPSSLIAAIEAAVNFINKKQV